LACILRLQPFSEDTVIVQAGEVPPAAYLIATGEVNLVDPAKPTTILGTIGADQFFGVRDSMHQIQSGVVARAAAGSTLAVLDANRLRALTERSPEHVIAVLERLG
jgi:CRP-like cAMP-binding protein